MHFVHYMSYEEYSHVLVVCLCECSVHLSLMKAISVCTTCKMRGKMSQFRLIYFVGCSLNGFPLYCFNGFMDSGCEGMRDANKNVASFGTNVPLFHIQI